MRLSTRALLAVLTGFALVVAGLYALAFAVLGEGLPRGARVGHVSIGGLSRPDAVARLEREYAARAEEPIPVAAGDVRTEVDPVAAGLFLDADATLDAASGWRHSPVHLVRALLGDLRIDPVVSADPSRLTAAVNAVAKKVDRPVREGTVRFEGTRPVPVAPEAGAALRRAAAAQGLRASHLRSRRPVVLPVERLAPTVTSQDVDRALREVAAPAIAAPVRLVVDGRAIEVPPAAIAANLRFVPGDSTGLAAGRRLESRLDGAGLRRALASRLAAVETEPRDAGFRIVAGAPRLTPSANGRTVPPEALARAVSGVLARPAPRTATVGLVVTPPALTTAEARTLNVRERISRFTTRHPCCAPRVTNIHRIADIVNGALVLPGETFSLNGYVGPRDRARGFVEAPMISDGEFRDSVGGGVSQFATTLFNAAFFAGLEIVEHQPHSYYISRYPAGREATVSWPQPDLRFRNDANSGVLITTSYTRTSITVWMWGTKRYEIDSASGPRSRPRPFATKDDSSPDCHASSGGPGFDIVVWRVFKAPEGARTLRRERFFTRYLPEPRVICR